MNANEQLIDRFYRAFQQRDAATMVACYAPDVQFSDPVFTGLAGPRAGAMWRMLCERGKDLKIEFRDVRADDRSGSAHWDAWYTFGGTGRPVHNSIDATFEFAGGRIVRHQDRFNLHRWAGQALGVPGKLLGWTPLLQNKIRKMAATNLDQFLARSA
jgi:ketosteroid isomerase-like protein